MIWLLPARKDKFIGSIASSSSERVVNEESQQTEPTMVEELVTPVRATVADIVSLPVPKSKIVEVTKGVVAKSVPAIAATNDVPFPLSTPVRFVEIVIAGVVPALATDPENPLALAMLTVVTVPAFVVTKVPLSAKTLPVTDPGAGANPFSDVVNGSSKVVA